MDDIFVIMKGLGTLYVPGLFFIGSLYSDLLTL